MLKAPWIKHYASSAIPAAHFTVDYETRGGFRDKRIVGNLNWSISENEDDPDDIVAYRILDTTVKTHKEKDADPVNHPGHYTAGKVECIDALESATVNLTGIEAVCTANAIKYLWRWKQKNGIEDLRKARWYIQKLIDSEDESC